MINAVRMNEKSKGHILENINYSEWKVDAFSRGDFYMVWESDSFGTNTIEVMTEKSFRERYRFIFKEGTDGKFAEVVVREPSNG